VDGLLVPNADAEALASAIARVDADRQFLSRASHAARNRALENTKTFWSEYRAGLIRDLFAPH
jgi:glycosyltransferase involved in cell wall biosynthesis